RRRLRDGLGRLLRAGDQRTTARAIANRPHPMNAAPAPARSAGSRGRGARVAMLLLAAVCGGAAPAAAQLALRAVSRPLGQPSGDSFGWSLAGLGDINGDGVDDWIVGAPGADTRVTDGGRAYVFLGGARSDSIPDLVISGTAILGHLGKTVAAIGDVNQD